MDKEKSSGNSKSEKTDKANYSGDENQLIEREAIENTPFTAVKVDDKGWFLTMGKFRLTETYGTLGEAEKEAHKIDWWRIMGVIQIMIENYDAITHKPYRGTPTLPFTQPNHERDLYTRQQEDKTT